MKNASWFGFTDNTLEFENQTLEIRSVCTVVTMCHKTVGIFSEDENFKAILESNNLKLDIKNDKIDNENYHTEGESDQKTALINVILAFVLKKYFSA